MWTAAVLGYGMPLMHSAQLELEKLPGVNGSSLVARLRGRHSLETVHNVIETM
jgi:hypothetical protein